MYTCIHTNKLSPVPGEGEQTLQTSSHIWIPESGRSHTSRAKSRLHQTTDEGCHERKNKRPWVCLYIHAHVSYTSGAGWKQRGNCQQVCVYAQNVCMQNVCVCTWCICTYVWCKGNTIFRHMKLITTSRNHKKTVMLIINKQFVWRDGIHLHACMNLSM